MGARVYAPYLGRFLQTDPVTGGSANAYDYSDQDPSNQVDVSGLSPVDRGCDWYKKGNCGYNGLTTSSKKHDYGTTLIEKCLLAVGETTGAVAVATFLAEGGGKIWKWRNIRKAAKVVIDLGKQTVKNPAKKTVIGGGIVCVLRAVK